MNNRRHQRHRAANVAAHMRMENRIALCKVEDISESGVFIRTDERLPLGLAVAVDLARPGLKKALRLTGKVARQASRGKVGIGIQFDGLDPEAHALLVQLITDLAKDKSNPPRPEAIEPQPPEPSSLAEALPSVVVAPELAAAPTDPTRLFIQVKGLLMELGNRDETVRQRDGEIEALKAQIDELHAEVRMLRAAGARPEPGALDAEALRREVEHLQEHVQALLKQLGRP